MTGRCVPDVDSHLVLLGRLLLRGDRPLSPRLLPPRLRVSSFLVYAWLQ